MCASILQNAGRIDGIQQSGDSHSLPTGTAVSGGDRYTGLDRFGRVDDQNWFNSSGGTIDRLQYGYDADGDLPYEKNIVSSGNSQLYTYDSLDRLTDFKRGTLASMNTSISSPSVHDSWGLDALANWDTLTTGLGGTTATNDYTLNSQNELTNDGINSITYDNDGNTLTSGSATFTYNAWNEMMSVSGVVIGSYTDSETFNYTADGMRATSRATYTSSGLSLTDISPESLYYSASGQMLSMGHLGFPDQPPKDTQLFAQALEGVENPIFNESNIEPPDGVKGVKKTFDEGNIGLAHANIGSDPNALDWLITQAQSVDVPVK